MSSKATMSIVEAAARLGIGKNAAYAAVARGEIPVITIGKRKKVPIPAFEAMLHLKSRQEAVAIELFQRLRQEGLA